MAPQVRGLSLSLEGLHFLGLFGEDLVEKARVVFLPFSPLSSPFPAPARDVDSRGAGAGAGAGFARLGWTGEAGGGNAEEGMSLGPGFLVSSPGIATT